MAQKLLLADDSVTVQRVIELTFADEGMTVITAGDGRQAIQRIEQERPDIVLADVTMPELDGYEVAAHVKNTEHLAHIPVVLMTGAFEQIDEARARAVGCDGILAKPFEPHMIIALVRQLLDKGETAVSEPSGGSMAGGYPFEAAASPGTSPSLDDYFDRLDEALAAHQPPGNPRVEAEGPSRSAALHGNRLSGTRPAPAASRGSLADAFSALLADELGEAPAASETWPSAPISAPGTSPRTVTDVSATPAPAALHEVTDVLVEEVTRRVVARLADQSVRDVVSATVLEVAERLVREEIERIKSDA